MIMQQLLPIVLRRSTHPKVTSVLVDIYKYFNAICSKAIVIEHMERLEKSIVITLCNLEKIFPPNFFTIMIHLVVHLASEAKVVGPVHYRWMYPIERYLLTLKKYVRTRSHPEGSIAEKYLVDESMTFCSRFLHNVETKSNRTERYIDGYYDASTHTSLTKLKHGQVHRYIIFNLDIIEIFRNLYIDDLKQRYVYDMINHFHIIDISFSYLFNIYV
ncbi:hypothetical protein ZOSMA_211G00040 [Zostera marina]|uniref:DUF4218 domain-containing protein n=1 Tax=Zostera marina TaxID=29655 RepID=A0A0K9PMN7_ZOSMR|nr:hypothetical protein ZOSMA_211G00040 [Zostera marina]